VRQKFPTVTTKARLTASRIRVASLVAFGSEEHVAGGRVYKILKQENSNSWFGVMNDLVHYVSEIEDAAGSISESFEIKVRNVIQSAGEIAREVVRSGGGIINEAAGQASKAAKDSALDLLIPVGIALGGLVVLIVVLTKSGAVAEIAGAVK